MNLFEEIPKTPVRHAHIADIHFGAMNPAYQYNILKEQFLGYLIKNPVDIVFVNGDLFDRNFLAGSMPVYYAMLFIKDLASYCINYNCSLVLLQGTASHDNKQLQLFYNLKNTPGLDLHIVTSIQTLLIKNLYIGCIPELYNLTEMDYRYILNAPTDLTIMHGTLKELAPFNTEVGLNGRTPVFTLNNFINTTLVMSGHIHRPSEIANFQYCGSPYTWKFGEEYDKGFFIVTQVPCMKSYSKEFIKINSIDYKTIRIDNIIDKQPNEIRDYINSLDDGVSVYRIKADNVTNKLLSSINILKDYYSRNSRYKVVINNIEQVKENNKNEIPDEFSFILDKTLSPYEMMSRYISIVNDVSIPPDEMINLLKK